jgi:transposase
LTAKIKELEKINRQNQLLIKQLQQELEQFRLNMEVFQGMVFNKVPSVAKNKNQSEKQKSGKKIGGQKNHKRSAKKKKPADRTEDCRLSHCPDCNQALNESSSYDTHKVEDVILKSKSQEVVEYHQYRYYCPHCHKWLLAIPTGVLPSSWYGINTVVLTLIFRYVNNTPLEKISQTFRLVYGLEIKVSGLSNLLQKAAEYLGEEYGKLLERLRASPIKHADETSFSINGNYSWVWGFFTEHISYYSIEKTRGKEVPVRILGNIKKTDVLVKDGYAAYTSLEMEQQGCWAHLIRKGRDLAKLENASEECKELTKKIADLYQEIRQFTTAEHSVAERQTAYVNYQEKVRQLTGSQYCRKDAKRLQTYLANQGDKFLTCIRIAGVPMTNNLAERELRPMVLVRKISNGCRSEAGAEALAVNASIVRTIRKQQGDVMTELKTMIINHQNTGLRGNHE